ncbi:MAG: hypothetical protein ACM35E_01130 [Deltaproteobacteria bacterium]
MVRCYLGVFPDWRAAMMVAAVAFMVARGGDMLDDGDERGETQ